MNAYLQNIRNLLQQSSQLTEQDKEALLKAIANADKQWNITEFKLDRTEKVKKTTAILLEETIEELEQKRKAVEAQNRELAIEAALERVRAIAMSMKEPADMLEVCRTISQQLELLKVNNIRNIQTAIFYEEKGIYLNYEYFRLSNKTTITEVKYKLQPDVEAFVNQMLTDPEAYFTTSFAGTKLNEWIEYQKTANQFVDKHLYEVESLHYYFYSIGPGALGISAYSPLNEEEINLLKRFRNVFELAYRRYTDIEKAEAQAREAKIEAALERTRTQSMIMQHSKELDDTLRVFHEQVLLLGINSAFSFLWLPDEDKDRHIFWAAWAENLPTGQLNKNSSTVFRSKAINYPLDRSDPATAQCLIDWKSDEPVYSYFVTPAEVENYFAVWQELIDGVETLQPQHFRDGLYYVEAFMKYGCFGVMIESELSEDEKKILSRFSVEFERTYTRFLDLQKAEEQAREAKIEAALEKVRSRSLAMHKSEELQEVVHTVFERLKELNVDLYTAIIFIFTEGSRDIVWWLQNKANQQYSRILVPYADNPYLKDIFDAKENGKDFFSATYSFEEKNELFHHLFEYTDFKYTPERQKHFLLESELATMSVALAKNTGINITSYSRKSFSEKDNELLKRFAKVFEQSYTRFLDLQKAEAQAREAQIEAALEKVRSRTMAMQHSDELKDAAALLFQQVKSLGVPAYSCGYNIWEENEKEFTSWMSTQDGSDFNAVLNIPLTEDDNFIRFAESRKKGEPFFVLELRGERMQQHYQYLKTIPAFKAYFDYAVSAGFDLPETQIHHLANFSHGNLLFITLDTCPEFHDVFKRFAAVFDQTYTRFLDLQKAEGQAREAQIELGLERVRARAMAMQNSTELSELVSILFEELTKLDLILARCIIWIFDSEALTARMWMANSEDKKTAESYFIKRLHHSYYDAIIDGWMERKSKWVYDLKGEEKKSIDTLLLSETELARLPEAVKTGIIASEETFVSGSFNNFGLIEASGPVRHSDEQLEILNRFGKVFDLSYTRFNDLKQAEARAREATIEAALEKVRGKAMAMHNSNDLSSAASVVFAELRKLGINSIRSGVGLLTRESRKVILYSATSTGDEDNLSLVGWALLQNHPVLSEVYDSWTRGEDYFPILQGDLLKTYYDQILSSFTVPSSHYVQSLPGNSLNNTPHDYIQYGFFLAFSNGFFYQWAEKTVNEDEIIILKRFASVIDLTFKRYFDLQKAEAQAREAQIEAALERVRARTMAMQSSSELPQAANLLFQQIQSLGMPAWSAGYCIWDDDKQAITLWMSSEGVIQPSLRMPLTEDPSLMHFLEAHQRGESFFVEEVGGEALKEHYTYLRTLPGVKESLDDIEKAGFPVPTYQIFHLAYFTYGFLLFITYEPVPEAHDIFKRFGKVFEQTYTRFLDLQKAEALAKESRKQAALDRVRADIASMRTTNDLERITPLIWNELTVLGVPFIRCGVFIMDDEQQLIHTFLSTREGKAIAAFHLPYATPGKIQKVLGHWRNRKNYNDHWNESDFIEFAETLVNQKALSSAEDYLKTIPHRGFYLHFLPFLQGMLYVGNSTKLGEEEIKLIQSVAAAFSTAYARYEDFNKLEAAKQEVDNAFKELRSTQQQLIQSEKMASLGELTAGIAHEIQNPLNFVNNFSEVNAELIEELKGERSKLKGERNEELEDEILNDVKQNLEKILHHGKRADAIVKGMLQHSRVSTGQKESTDISALADEYLRLSYHGLRAKDKNFNATLHTDFDTSIGKINIVPQDIGRVLLNLFNNAFYAMKPPNPLKGEHYKPTVRVSTKRIDRMIFISVKDNGNGIPKNIVDKIFQPFFTTKPTGQGTGLGLSLSYDIVKAHGGEIKVETKEGEGSEFIVQLPI